MTCLICRYFQPTEPAQHKVDREAGRCASACGNRWNQITAIHHVRNHGPIKGWCRLHPEPRPFDHNHVCGYIVVREFFHNQYWAVERLKPDDNLFEWAQNALTAVINGTWNWREQHRLAEENTELKRQLKAARKISASRLKRLQEPEKEKKPSRELEPTVFPHLVAAE